MSPQPVSKYGGVPFSAGPVSKYGGVPVVTEQSTPDAPLTKPSPPGFVDRFLQAINPLPLFTQNPLKSLSGIMAPFAVAPSAESMAWGGHATTPEEMPGVQDLENHNWSGLGGTAAATLLPLAAGAVVKSLPNVKDINPFNIRTAVTRAWNPAKADVQFPEVAPEAVSEVKTYGRPRSFTNEETIHAANDAIEHHQQLLDNWIQHAEGRGIKISGDRIVDAVRESIPYTDQLEYPDQVRSILQRYQTAYGGRMFKPSEMRTILGNKNAAAQALHSKAPAAQRIADITGSNPALEEAAAEGARGALYEGIDPDNFGAGPAEIQRRTGEIIKLRNAAEGRRNSVIAEKPLTPLGAVGNVAEGALNALGAPFHGGLKGALGEIGHPITGPTDALIQRIYANSPEATPLPQPYPYKPWDPARPVNLLQPWNPRQLPGPTPRLPAAPDLSSVQGIDAMYPTGPNPARALPPATTRISSMPGGTGANPTTTSSPLVSPQSPSPSVAAPPIAPIDPSGPVPLGWKTVWDTGSKSYRYVRK